MGVLLLRVGVWSAAAEFLQVSQGQPEVSGLVPELARPEPSNGLLFIVDKGVSTRDT